MGKGRRRLKSGAVHADNPVDMESTQTTQNPAAGTPPVPDLRPQRGRTRQIAVLFTDVVGSTRYFKNRGDAAGRKMLQHHVELASGPIGREKGVLVKTIGDAVMAYFQHPLEAVQAAVEIQKTFFRFNRDKGLDEQIHVRIGIHYGQGIVEEKDIFGNVVNLAAKLMPLVGGDQIFITDTVHGAMGSDCPVPAERIDGGRQAAALAGIALYNLVWHKEAAASSAQGAFVQFRLCPALTGKAFSEIWTRFLGLRQHIWSKRVQQEAVEEQSVLAVVPGVTEAVELAGEVLVHFQKAPGRGSVLPLVPVQILIDQGTYPRNQPLALKAAGIDWAVLDPGKIHLTAAAAGAVADKKAFPMHSVAGETESGAVQVLLTTLTHGKELSERFLYQGLPAEGPFARCFYCGDRRHRAGDCPSKSGDPRPGAVRRLGQLPVGEINRAYFAWLTASPPLAMALQENGRAEPPAMTAFKAYCDLGFCFQLRFFMLLWDSTEEDWETLRKGRSRGGRGGPLWLALDCLRTGNLAQAEYLIDSALDRYGKDYRTHAILGLVHLEKGNVTQAELAFTRAQDLSRTDPQWIFVSLLLYRLMAVSGDRIRAEKILRRIVSRHPRCPDARYLAIRQKLQAGLEKKAMTDLVNLIQDRPRFYLHAMIDPDLASASARIQHELGRLLARAREAAEKPLPVAEAEVRRFQEVFGEFDTEVARERSLLTHAEQLASSGSYFGLLEAAETARAISARVKGTIQGRKRGMGRTLMELEMRCTRLVNQTRGFSRSKTVARLLSDLATAYSEVVEMKAMVQADHPEIFTTLFKRADELSARLDEIARTLKRMADMREIRRFLVAFVNRSLVFQSVNLLIGIVLFPLVNYYLHFLIPGFHISSLYLVFYQKIFLLLGGLAGVMLAVLLTAKVLYPR